MVNNINHMHFKNAYLYKEHQQSCKRKLTYLNLSREHKLKMYKGNVHVQQKYEKKINYTGNERNINFLMLLFY